MKFLFLIITCLQLFTVIQCSLTDVGIGVKGKDEYKSFGTARSILENGTLSEYGVIIITSCVVVTVADACHNSKAMEIWSGQSVCSKYEQRRLVNETHVQGDLCVIVTNKPFAVTGATLPVGTNFVDGYPQNVTAVGCAPPVDTINKAIFYGYPLETCNEFYNDTTLQVGADGYCGRCPIPAPTCSAPRGNPIYSDGRPVGISNRVHPLKCAEGGYVQFIRLCPHAKFINEIVEKTSSS
ncbi:uncharacterized protein LOC126763557 [Bactrocera neohumeralis]|uniref:uncharacterized protein LOC126763557 n=1 Tax=Bactrocera neohumeralis TaxID=98809 RepID=UPI0021657B6F|nr:uncharacterized protein LOC126763557 [Bactrocera neohumeralis]